MGRRSKQAAGVPRLVHAGSRSWVAMIAMLVIGAGFVGAYGGSTGLDLAERDDRDRYFAVVLLVLYLLLPGSHRR